MNATPEETEEQAAAFQKWWYKAGSGMAPLPGEDVETHVHRISEIAWREGGFVAASRSDKLAEVFRLQAELNERMGINLSNLARDGEKEKQTYWILNFTRAMQQEMSELIDSVPWKWWAKYQEFDAQNARVEVVDLFHFLVSLAQTLGMSADDVYEAYLAKNKVNHRRQESGYTVKDHDDSRHI